MEVSVAQRHISIRAAAQRRLSAPLARCSRIEGYEKSVLSIFAFLDG